jgi:hypothetical protein
LSSRKARIFTLGVASPYDVANQILDEIAEALTQLGHQVKGRQVNSSASDWLRQLVEWSPDWVVSINGVALDVTISGLPLPAFVGAKPLSIVLDNPHHFAQRWAKAGEGIVTVTGEKTVSGLRQLWPNLGEVFYLPHGASTAGGYPLPSVGRTHDLLFSATYACPHRLRTSWQERLPHVRDWLEDQAICLAASTEVSAWDLFSSDDLHLLCVQQLARADLEEYIRCTRRFELVRTMTEAGLQLTLVGRGWEDHPDAGFHRLAGPQSFAQLLRTFGDSRVVLHGTTSLDSHERPLTAMLQGAAVIADANPFFTRHFQSDRDLVTYRWEDVEAAAAAAQELLRDESRRLRIAASGQRRVQEGHRWIHRLQKLPIVGWRK